MTAEALRAPALRRKPLGPNGVAAVVGVVLLLVGVLGFLLLVQPKRSEASTLDEEIARLQAEYDAGKAAAFAPVPEPVRVADLFRLAKAMPNRVDMSGVLLELNELARESGIVFESITPGALAPQGSYQVLPVTLLFKGNFYSLSDFLFRTRNLVHVRDGALSARGRLFAVDSISFTEGTSGFPDIAATLTVNAFVFGKGAPAPAPTPAPAPAATTPAATAPAPTTAATDPAATAPAPTTPAPTTTDPAAGPAAAVPTG